MTQKSCAVGMRNAILRNYLKRKRKTHGEQERKSDIIFVLIPDLFNLLGNARSSVKDVCLKNLKV